MRCSCVCFGQVTPAVLSEPLNLASTAKSHGEVGIFSQFIAQSLKKQNGSKRIQAWPHFRAHAVVHFTVVMTTSDQTAAGCLNVYSCRTCRRNQDFRATSDVLCGSWAEVQLRKMCSFQKVCRSCVFTILPLCENDGDFASVL